MHPIVRLRSIIRLIVIGSLAAGCVAANDAPIPAGYDDRVAAARTSLEQNLDGLIRPTLSFAEVQCFANGGHVVVFTRSDKNDPSATAWTIQGPGAPADGWGGGFGAQGMAEEIAFNFAGVPRVPCPPR